MIKTQGFTLQEMVIVVVVMGLLASLALPRLMRVREATILSEGIQVLQPLRSAQERRILEGNAYTADCNDLDITVGTLANFNAPNCFNDGRVSIQRTGGAYTITATPVANSPDSYACAGGAICTYLDKYLP